MTTATMTPTGPGALVLPSVVWHASRTHAARPTLAGRTPGGHHPNSGLGLFCATTRADYLRGFGAFLHRLTLRSPLRVLPMTVNELRQMGDAMDLDEPQMRAWFEAEGQRRAETYDLIALVELENRVDQVIILRDEVIVGHEMIPFMAT